MSAELLRRAAALMRERAEAATGGGFGWHVTDLAGGNEVWANRDAAGWDAFMVASTATRLNPNPGERGYADAAHIASWHPAVALAVANWLDAVADLAPPDPHHADEECETCEQVAAALEVARAYLGEDA